jgi:hypothetical protein
MKIKTKKADYPGEDMRDAFELIVKAAVKTIEEGANLPGRLIAVTNNKNKDKKEDKEQISLKSLPFDEAFDNDLRMELAGMAGRTLSMEGELVDMFVVAFEAWGSKVKNGGEKSFRDLLVEGHALRPSEDPERFSALIISAIDFSGNSAFCSFKIIPKGKKNRLIDIEADSEKPVKEFEINWSTLEERKIAKKEKGVFRDSPLIDMAWKEYKLARAGF